MRKRIGKKNYDTATAQMVAQWHNNPADDLEKVWETLYQKRSGEYFLHGIGNSLTPYCDLDKNPIMGEKLIPMTYEQARDWTIDRLGTDRARELFEIPTDNPIRFCMQMDADEAGMLAEMARESHFPSKGALVRQLIRDAYRAHKA